MLLLLKAGVLIHTVVKGDTLWNISRKYQVATAAILAANPAITNSSQIKIGQKITIPR